MVRRGLPDTSKGARWGQSRPVMVIAALLLALALPVRADECAGFSCEKICNDSHLEFKPQKCDQCCHSPDDGEAEEGNGDITERMKEMEESILELRVMVIVILAFMVLLLLAVVALFLRQTSTQAIKTALPVFFRSKDEGRASIEKRPPPPTKVPHENRNSTVVRIADYQNNHSPLSKRMRPNGQAHHEAAPAVESNFPPSGEPPRTRQPSESTCPDESNDLPHAYDNLALSTSTLHDTTTSSTSSTLGPAVSTNTLDTTLPSVNPTTPVLRQVSA